MSKQYKIPHLPLPYDLETKAVLKQLNKANRKLAELKGGCPDHSQREYPHQYAYFTRGKG